MIPLNQFSDRSLHLLNNPQNGMVCKRELNGEGDHPATLDEERAGNWEMAWKEPTWAHQASVVIPAENAVRVWAWYLAVPRWYSVLELLKGSIGELGCWCRKHKAERVAREDNSAKMKKVTQMDLTDVFGAPTVLDTVLGAWDTAHTLEKLILFDGKRW